MKKATIIIMGLLLLSCKTDKKKTSVETNYAGTKNSEVFTVEGHFIFYGDVAILQGRSEIYGVVIDSVVQALNHQAETYKKKDTDMVPVVVKAKLTNKNDGTEWEKKIEILEILKISEPKPENNQVINLK